MSRDPFDVITDEMVARGARAIADKQGDDLIYPDDYELARIVLEAARDPWLEDWDTFKVGGSE